MFLKIWKKRIIIIIDCGTIINIIIVRFIWTKNTSTSKKYIHKTHPQFHLLTISCASSVIGYKRKCDTLLLPLLTAADFYTPRVRVSCDIELFFQTDWNDETRYTFTGHRERAQNKITERLNRQAILDEKMKKFLAVRFNKWWTLIVCLYVVHACELGVWKRQNTTRSLFCTSLSLSLYNCGSCHYFVIL